MKAFDLISSEWEERRNKPFSAISFFLPKARGIILDAGCGNARNSVEIAKKAERVYCVDSSAEMLKFAGKRIKESNARNIIVRKSSIAKLPFKANFFESILCTAVLHHLKKKEQFKALQEFFRVLKPSGLVFLTVWNKQQEKFRGEKKEALIAWKTKNGKAVKRYYYFFSENELKKLAKKAGFRVVESFYERNGNKVEAKGARNLCLWLEKA